MLEREFLVMGSTTLSWEPLSGLDDYGAPSYAASTSADCIIERGRKLVAKPDGQTEVANATIYVLSTSATIGLQDRLSLPGSTEEARILAAYSVRDEDGQHHYEVLVA